MLKKHIHYCVDKNKGIPSTLSYEGLPLSNAIRVLMVLLKGNKILHLITFLIWRRHPDLNRGIGVLQTRVPYRLRLKLISNFYTIEQDEFMVQKIPNI